MRGPGGMPDYAPVRAVAPRALAGAPRQRASGGTRAEARTRPPQLPVTAQPPSRSTGQPGANAGACTPSVGRPAPHPGNGGRRCGLDDPRGQPTTQICGAASRQVAAPRHRVRGDVASHFIHTRPQVAFSCGSGAAARMNGRDADTTGARGLLGTLGGLLRARDREFFDLFERAAMNVARAAELLEEMLVGFPESQGLARDILICEQDGDHITQEVIRRINETFVTPIDRSDILRLTSALDDIVDYTEEVADYLGLYHAEAPMLQAQGLAHVLVDATRELAAALPLMREFKDVS